MGVFVLTFAAVMCTIYAREIFRDDDPAVVDHKPPLKFEGRPVGPWAYFAEQMKPRQRSTF
jgi:hypothetical protein